MAIVGSTSARESFADNDMRDNEDDGDVPLRRRGRGRPSNAEREARRQYEERVAQRGHGNGPQASSASNRRRIVMDEDDTEMEDSSNHR